MGGNAAEIIAVPLCEKYSKMHVCGNVPHRANRTRSDWNHFHHCSRDRSVYLTAVSRPIFRLAYLINVICNFRMLRDAAKISYSQHTGISYATKRAIGHGFPFDWFTSAQTTMAQWQCNGPKAPIPTSTAHHQSPP